MTDNLQIMTPLYQNLEILRIFFCSPRPAELCIQTTLLQHADPGAEIHLSCQAIVRDQLIKRGLVQTTVPRKSGSRK